MTTHNLHDGWLLAHFDPQDLTLSGPPPGGWLPVQVPGTVQTSPFGLPRADLYQNTNITRVQWMHDRLWVYRRDIAVPAAATDETVRLIFEGLDYRYEVWLDGVRLVDGEGMFHPIVINLDNVRDKSVRVEVRLLPPPNTVADYLETTKAQFGRGWDFAPKLATVGIWDEVRLEVVPRLRVESAFIETRLENRQRARVTVHAKLSEPVHQGWAEITLAGSRRRVPLLDADHLTAFIEVDSPQLWWPNGLGAPVLHDLTVTLVVPGRPTTPFSQRVGLREVHRVPAAGQRPGDIPLQYVINGRPFFINGVNWVPPDSCIGDITDSQYDGPLAAFRAGHVNLIRVWGGGLCEKAHFYDRCDELGLLVFQEYPIACGLGTSDRYLRQLQAESRQIACKLRHHPSVFLFCGGNENYHYWSMLNGRAPALRDAADKARQSVTGGQPFANPEWLAGAVQRYDEPVHLILGGVTAELAPHCLYQNTSAMDGEGELHGGWTWNPKIGDHRFRMFDTLYDYWCAANHHLYSEASISSIANLATIADVTGDSAKFPAFTDETWTLHHAFHAAWDKHRDLWVDLPATEKIFGPITDLRELVILNQYLQAEGGRFMIEELRRKQPHTTGLIWWGVNEPWPGLAGNALIDYFGRPKLAWSYITQAFAPVILSLRYHALQPDVLRGELWISCNAPAGFAGRYEVAVSTADGSIINNYAGRCQADYLESQTLRSLIPVELAPVDCVKVRAILFDEQEHIVHENVYLFGQIRAAVLAKHGAKV